MHIQSNVFWSVVLDSHKFNLIELFTLLSIKGSNRKEKNLHITNIYIATCCYSHFSISNEVNYMYSCTACLSITVKHVR